MPPKRHFCDCTKCMSNGATQPVSVSRTTWHNHAKFRDQARPAPPSLDQFLLLQPQLVPDIAPQIQPPLAPDAGPQIKPSIPHNTIMSTAQYATLLSCFVFAEKSEQTTKLKEELMAPLRVMEVGR
ncbi:hypothetical protein BJ912DRAFT_1058317 [Pholiota molesta]|nr:hypothetical protein BJ912DRAFT_1058317 [Pholiota molesta]